MAITTRASKGSALTHTEMDANLTNLNNDKLEKSDERGFKNYIINGGFDVWQRGTSFDSTTGTGKRFLADRWSTYYYEAGGEHFHSQQTGENSRYSIRFGRTSGATNTQPSWLVTELEVSNSVTLAGGKATLSFVAKRGSYTNTGDLIVNIKTGTSGDESWVSSYTGEATSGTSTIALTETKTKYYLTVDIASNIKQVSVQFLKNANSGTADVNDWFEIEEVQLEEGSVATPFEQRPYGLELSLCQRYYEQHGVTYFASASGTGFSGNTYHGHLPYKVVKRVSPTVTLYDASSTIGQITAYSGATAYNTTYTLELPSTHGVNVISHAGTDLGLGRVNKATIDAEL